MMSALRNFKIQHKMLLSNALYIILIGAIIFFSLNSSALIKRLSGKQKASDGTADGIQRAATDIRAYLDKNIPYSGLVERRKALDAEQNQQNLSGIFEKLWADVGQIRQLRAENAQMEDQINGLTDYAIQQSNGYIQQVVPKLVDKETRGSVTDLERKVILGADINTTSNYRIKVLFGRLKGDIHQKDAFLALCTATLENTEKDLKHLAGTPFEELPRKAKESILKIRELSLTYIKNMEAEASVRKAIFDGINARLKDIRDIKDKNSATLFGTMKTYFRNMLIIILVVSLIGILASVVTARSVSRTLREVIGGMSGASQEVASASGQMSTASQSLAEGTSEQAAAIEETSSSLEEILSMTKLNSENTMKCKTIMQEARRIVGRVDGHMSSMSEAIAKITISSGQTIKIVKTIDEIAFQTNLLALNAAVEAARAGEAGAGFAVVADEVRNLAMRAAEAAKNTTNLIDNTIKAVKEGSELMELTKGASRENIENAEKVDGLVAEIAVASQEQAKGIEQLNTAVADMEKATQQNAAHAEESAAASEEMSAQAEKLNELVEGLVALVGGSENGKRKEAIEKPPRYAVGHFTSKPFLRRIEAPGEKGDPGFDTPRALPDVWER